MSSHLHSSQLSSTEQKTILIILQQETILVLNNSGLKTCTYKLIPLLLKIRKLETMSLLHM